MDAPRFFAEGESRILGAVKPRPGDSVHQLAGNPVRDASRNRGSSVSVAAPAEASGLSFFERHEFLIRRLHSLSGLIPVGAYMVVHLTVNASVLKDPAALGRLIDAAREAGLE